MNAFENVWKSVTGVPAADMSTKKYTAVTYDANGNIVTPAAGAKAIGVLYEPNGAGEPAQVVASGFAFVMLGGTVAPGDALMVDANGDVVKHVVATAPAVNYVFGTAAVGGAAGELGTILLG